MISWIDNIQVRFKLDTGMIEILLDHGYDPSTYYHGEVFTFPSESDLLFTALADFRAGLLYQMTQGNNTASCPLSTNSCVKMPDMFNLAQDSLQHLYNIHTAYVPVLVMIFPDNGVLHTLNNQPLLFSVILPALLCASFHLVNLPLFCLIIQFLRREKLRENITISSNCCR